MIGHALYWLFLPFYELLKSRKKILREEDPK
jgi:hypothetical protein